MKVRLSAEARQDLTAIADYIARDNPSRARSFVQELTGKCGSLAALPEGYPLVQRYEQKGVRRRVHGNYSIFYRIVGEQIFVLHVLHGAQDYEAILP
jgi:toxin ParE1/3/4